MLVSSFGMSGIGLEKKSMCLPLKQQLLMFLSGSIVTLLAVLINQIVFCLSEVMNFRIMIFHLNKWTNTYILVSNNQNL